MAKTSFQRWNPDFMNLSPLFFPLRPQADILLRDPAHWPDLADYQALLASQSRPPLALSGARIQFVPQSAKSPQWQEDYEPRIFLTGQVQTQLRTWHDFFQVLVWATFPRSKAVINAKHYEAIHRRNCSNPPGKHRTPVENALTQFDECGAIVVSSEPELLQWIREFRWKELFWGHREAVKSHLQCFVFGHAVYEKALNPYIGLTAHAVLFEVEKDFLRRPLATRLSQLDERTAEAFERDRYPCPKNFQPFPLLGMPGWDNNDAASYYDNHDYFRPGRKE